VFLHSVQLSKQSTFTSLAFKLALLSRLDCVDPQLGLSSGPLASMASCW